MKNTVEIKKVKNKRIEPLQYSKLIITGKQARAVTSYDNNIKTHLFWRALKNNEIAKAIFIEDMQNFKKELQELQQTNFKNIYYRTNETQTNYEFKKIARNITKTKNNNLVSLYKSIKKAKDIINTNITKNTLMITLTYAENMQDPKRLYNDLNLFIKNLKNYYDNNFKDTFKYFRAIEPQERGAWHAHILIFCKYKNIIDNNEITEKLWKNGYTSTQRIKAKNNVGSYITSYLTNLTPEPNETNESKKNKKGKRLHLYPSHLKIFTHSNNLKNPIVMPETLHGQNVSDLEFKGFKLSAIQPKNAYQVKSSLTKEIIKCYNYENYDKE